jgi:hypothetical protein
MASDPHHLPLTYSATGLPAGLGIDSAGLITGTINTGDYGGSPYTVVVSVSNGKVLNGNGETASVQFTWTINL